MSGSGGSFIKSLLGISVDFTNGRTSVFPTLECSYYSHHLMLGFKMG